MIQALQEIRFDKFSNLSLKALRSIVPHMEGGMRYDEACNAAGYNHSKPKDDTTSKEYYLPAFYENHRGKERWNKNKMLLSERLEEEIQGGIPRNPVALRALNQARKVVNALIRKYGSPHAVHIEMARDLSRPLDERRTIEKEQKEYRERNDKERALFVEQFGRRPEGSEFEKFRLYREQHCKCAYSIQAIDLERLLEMGYEPPRELWRLQILREWSHGQKRESKEVFPGSQRTRGADGAGKPHRSPVAVVGG